MKNPRKHAELIKAWADGADVQYFEEMRKEWSDIEFPSWREATKYRLKPIPVIEYYKASGGFLFRVNRTGCPNVKLIWDENMENLKAVEFIE